MCNACGLFLRLHGTNRPLSLKTDVIKKRNRTSSVANMPVKMRKRGSRDSQVLEEEMDLRGKWKRKRSSECGGLMMDLGKEK